MEGCVPWAACAPPRLTTGNKHKSFRWPGASALGIWRSFPAVLALCWKRRLPKVGWSLPPKFASCHCSRERVRHGTCCWARPGPGSLVPGYVVGSAPNLSIPPALCPATLPTQGRVVLSMRIKDGQLLQRTTAMHRGSWTQQDGLCRLSQQPTNLPAHLGPALQPRHQGHARGRRPSTHCRGDSRRRQMRGCQ